MKKALRIIGKILAGICIIFTVATLIFLGINYDSVGNLLSTYTIVNQAFYEEPDSEALWDGMNEGLVNGLGDPYSAYMTKEEYDSMSERLQGGFAGIGIYFTVDDDGPLVMAVFEDSPAEAAGLLEGDRMLMADDISLDGLESDEIVLLLKGEEGTSFTLRVLRESGEEEDLVLTRAFVEYDSTFSSKIEDTDIGYIYISNFTMLTPEQFRDDLLELGDIDGLIIDLRNNGGGQTTGAYGVASLFLPEGPIVFEETRDSISTQEATGGNLELPLAVLVNGNTASASEILAGAIQDTKRGVLVGEQTFGKGTVQRFYQTLHGDYIKLTIARYLTPNKRSLHGIGLTPEYEVPMTEEEYMEAIYGENALHLDIDAQLTKAVEVLESGESLE
ncbi:S41 family peptidase [Clostridia bacterium]|nr:S41 family peptidase [Clostridia bacterium]